MRLSPSLLMAVLLVAAAPAAMAQNAPAPVQVEAWSQDKIIAMGREIFRQDRAAWLATDVLLAAHDMSELADLRGWIVVPGEDADVVRFLAAGETGVQARWDIRVDVDGAGPVKTALSPTLSADEIARWTARQTAIAAIGPERCTQTFNTVIARDPDGEGWLVWALAATQDASIPLGGHIRFHVSADGTTVVKRERLSMGCLTVQRPPDETVALFMAQLVSDKPLEVHVFLSMLNRIPIYVGIDDKIYMVAGDQITLQSAD